MQRSKKRVRSFVWRIFRWLLKCIGYEFETGTLTLLIDGNKSVTIDTGFTPKDVWISTGEPVGATVCQGDIDCFDVRIIPNGFVIFIRMSSTFRELQWVALR